MTIHNNSHTPSPNKKGATRCFSNNFHKCQRIFMIFGMQLCKWILIILGNYLLCYVARTSLTWWCNVDVNKIASCTWYCHVDADRSTSVHPPEMWLPNLPNLNPGLQHLVCPSREGITFADPWCEGVKRTSVEGQREWKLLDHSITVAAIAQWFRCLSACIRVNGTHSEHKFGTYDFLVSSICFIHTGYCKFVRYKHVRSANIAWNVTFVPENFTRSGSNKTNAWQKILTPSTLAVSY